jgi:exoribonuclease R
MGTTFLFDTIYETDYSSNVEPLYGAHRAAAADAILLSQNSEHLPHAYSVAQDRVDFTMRDTYSIDPPGCEDADDAFSLFTTDEGLFLAIHIADPTEWVSPDASLWSDIKERVVTRYPSNRVPIHLMPKDIVDRASLMVNQYGDTKNAITVLTEIHTDTFVPVGRIQLLFSTVRVTETHAFTYANASAMLLDNDDARAAARAAISTGLKVAAALNAQRAEITVGARLGDLAPAGVVFSSVPGQGPSLARADTAVADMQKMIAEFAIFANAFVGEHLKIHMRGAGIFRTCATDGWIDTVATDIGSEELMDAIIVNGIQADYLATNASHDLVGMPEYCHFTSPIRRLADCVCHYLIKYIYLRTVSAELVTPFTNDALTGVADTCLQVSKSMKKVQYRDTKFRLLQTMSHMLSLSPGEPIRTTFFVTGYKVPFLNLIVCKIGDHQVRMSYTLRVKKFTYDIKLHEKHVVEVMSVGRIGKFDEGILPDLDAFVIQLGA